MGLIMLTVLSASISFAEEDKPYGNLNLTFSSQYIWRGIEFSKNSLVIFPSMAVGYKGLEMGLWVFFDTDYYGYDEDRITDAPGDGSDALYETDWMISYGNNIGRLNYTLGWIYYDFDNTVVNVGGRSFQEVFMTLLLDIPLSPEVSVWREIEVNNDSLYVTGGLSHCFDFSDHSSLSFGAWVGYWDLPEGTGVSSSETREYKKLNDGNAWIAFDIFLNEYFTLTPHVYYTRAISNKAEEYLESLSFNGKVHWWVYGGLTLDVSF